MALSTQLAAQGLEMEEVQVGMVWACVWACECGCGAGHVCGRGMWACECGCGAVNVCGRASGLRCSARQPSALSSPLSAPACRQAELARQRDLNARMRHELAEQAQAAEEATQAEEAEAGQLAAAQVSEEQRRGNAGGEETPQPISAVRGSPLHPLA